MIGTQCFSKANQRVYSVDHVEMSGLRSSFSRPRKTNAAIANSKARDFHQEKNKEGTIRGYGIFRGLVEFNSENHFKKLVDDHGLKCTLTVHSILAPSSCTAYSLATSSGHPHAQHPRHILTPSSCTASSRHPHAQHPRHILTPPSPHPHVILTTS